MKLSIYNFDGNDYDITMKQVTNMYISNNRFWSWFQRIIATALLSLLISPQALADNEKTPPKFQVEIVVFETLALKGWTEEFWSDDIPILNLGDDDVMNAPSVKPEYFMLNDEVSKMTTRMGYNVLFHQAWVVNALPEKQAKPLYISVLPEKDYQSRLEGTLLFYKSRYPHIELNLELERKIPLVIRTDFAKNQNMQEDLLPEFWRFQLKESRKIKTGQIHYLDHPIFGALVEIKYLPDFKPNSEIIEPSTPTENSESSPAVGDDSSSLPASTDLSPDKAQ